MHLPCMGMEDSNICDHGGVVWFAVGCVHASWWILISLNNQWKYLVYQGGKKVQVGRKKGE